MVILQYSYVLCGSHHPVKFLYGRFAKCPIIIWTGQKSGDKRRAKSLSFTLERMKRSLSPSKDLRKKRAFIIDDSPVDPLEDSPQAVEGVRGGSSAPPSEGPPRPSSPPLVEEVVRVDPDLAKSFDTLADFVETGDLDGLHEKLTSISTKVSRIQDSKVRGVYASLNKVWQSIGALKNDINNLKEGNDSFKLDKAYGQSNRLYAWMKHVEKVEPRLGLPDVAPRYKPFKPQDEHG